MVRRPKRDESYMYGMQKAMATTVVCHRNRRRTKSEKRKGREMVMSRAAI